MTFKAMYMHRRATAPNYYRTIFADTLAEAQRIAERWAKKGFICVSVTSQEGSL